MKSEQRHELQKNELADQLANFLEKVAPYSRAIVGGILAVVVLFAAYLAWSQQQLAAEGNSWRRLFQVVAFDNPTMRDEADVAVELEKVTKEFQGTTASLWAILTEANLELDGGSRTLAFNRQDGRLQIERARALFERLEKAATGSWFLRQEAMFGSAQASEALGDVEKAKDKFQQAIKQNSESFLAKAAANRLKTLSDDENANFVKWYQSQEPIKRNPHAGIPGMGNQGMGGQGMGTPRGTSPTTGLDSLPFNLPDAPDINLPSALDDLKLKGAKKPDATDTKPEEKKPDDSTEKPADKPAEKPADSPAKEDAKKDPASDKPAEEKKVDEKKADEKADAPKPVDAPKADAPKAETPKPDSAKQGDAAKP